MTDTTPQNACPIAPVVDIVFSRWTTPILWALHEYGRQRFVELERDGLVHRTYHAEVPPRVEYEITPQPGPVVRDPGALVPEPGEGGGGSAGL